MKIPSSFTLPRITQGRLSVALALCLPAAALGQKIVSDWEGADGLGGNGIWTGANFTNAPASNRSVSFLTNETYTALDTVVTVQDGVTTSAEGIAVRNYAAGTTKSVTLNLGAGSTINAATGLLNVGGAGGGVNPESANSSTLRIVGPSTGTATLNAARLYQEGNTVNVGTTHRNTMILSGAGLVVNLNGTFSSAGSQGSILFDGGVQVNTLFASSGSNTAGGFHVRANSRSLPAGHYDNWMTVRHATISLHTLDVRGLFQLGEQGSLVATRKTNTSAAAELGIAVGTTDNKTAARFEAAGSGLDSSAVMTFYGQTTLAIGVSADPMITSGSEASQFTLDNTVNFSPGTFLEFELFGSGEDEVDKLIVGAGGKINITGSSTRIVLKLNGYELQGGESWQLIDSSAAASGWLTGSFNVSGLDTNVWDLSNFNEAGGWVISAQMIPEPSTYALVAFAGLGAVAMAFRRRLE